MRRISQHKDSNHDAITWEYQRLGCLVVSLAVVGNGCPDLLVKELQTGRLALVEVKSRRGKIKPAQEKFAREWQTRIVRTAADVVQHVQALRLAV